MTRMSFLPHTSHQSPNTSLTCLINFWAESPYMSLLSARAEQISFSKYQLIMVRLLHYGEQSLRIFGHVDVYHDEHVL